MRDHNQEYRDSAARKYAYDFDGVIRKYLLRALEPHFTRPGSALEMGCYKGDMTAQILEYFPSITVIEAASDLAKAVAARFGQAVTVVHASFEEARLARTFDNIFLVHTLEHLDDPVGVLRKASSWLAP